LPKPFSTNFGEVPFFQLLKEQRSTPTYHHQQAAIFADWCAVGAIAAEIWLDFMVGKQFIDAMCLRNSGYRCV
jgi:hypothetical protein